MLRSRRLATVGAAFAAAITAALPLASASPADASPAPTPTSYFGMHDSAVSPTSWPRSPIGSLRLWDTGTTWSNVEPSNGAWNTATLDALVSSAVHHRADPVVVLGGTPAWASSRPAPGAGFPAAFVGEGAADPPQAAAWASYVTFMVNRYKARGVHEYQVWNEPDVVQFWNGSPAQMAALSNTTVKLIKSIDRTAQVIAPSFVVRLPDAQRWFTAYAATGALRNVDAVSLQLYPLASQAPENSIALLGWAKKVLAAHKVVKPIWNSEINYGMSGGRQAYRSLSPAVGAAFVSRTLLLNKANGVSRVFWYNWAHNPILGVQMTEADGVTPTAAAAAYATTRRWMAGQVLTGCTRDRKGTYRCQITTAKTVGYVYWNPTAYRPVVALPRKTFQLEYLNGTVARKGAGAKVAMGQAPILVRVHR